MVLSYAVGARCPVSVPQGCGLEWTGAGFTLYISQPNISFIEMDAIKRQPIKLGLGVTPDLVFVTLNFNRVYNTEHFFTLAKQPEDEDEIANLLTDLEGDHELGLTVMLVVVDTPSQSVRAMRLMQFEPSFSRQMMKGIMATSKATRASFDARYARLMRLSMPELAKLARHKATVA